MLAQIDEKLNNWAACADGLLLKTERDHYLFIFEECHYDHFVEEKFSILDAIREIKVGDVCPTLSIGIGKDADAMAELYRNAVSAWRWPQPGRRPGGGPGKGGLPVLRRPQQVHGKAHQGEVPGHGQRPERADGRRVRDLYHGHSFADMDAVGARRGSTALPASTASGPRWSLIWSTTPPERFWPSSSVAGVCGGVHLRGGGIFENERRRLVIVVDTNRPDMVESPSCWSPATGWR